MSDLTTCAAQRSVIAQQAAAARRTTSTHAQHAADSARDADTHTHHNTTTNARRRAAPTRATHTTKHHTHIDHHQPGHTPPGTAIGLDIVARTHTTAQHNAHTPHNFTTGSSVARRARIAQSTPQHNRSHRTSHHTAQTQYTTPHHTTPGHTPHRRHKQHRHADTSPSLSHTPTTSHLHVATHTGHIARTPHTAHRTHRTHTALTLDNTTTPHTHGSHTPHTHASHTHTTPAFTSAPTLHCIGPAIACLCPARPTSSGFIGQACHHHRLPCIGQADIDPFFHSILLRQPCLHRLTSSNICWLQPFAAANQQIKLALLPFIATLPCCPIASQHLQTTSTNSLA